MSAPCLAGQAIAYIEGYFAEGIGLDNIAGALWVDASHLRRRFKRETGRTVTAHICDRRIHAARQLLLHSEKNMTDFALEVEYRSTPYFSYVFCRRTGCTPTTYRRSRGDP